MSSEVEDTLKRIQAYRGVIGVVILNADGVPIKSTLDNATTVQYASLVSSLTDKAKRTVKNMDGSNELLFLRMRTKKNEVMIASEKEFMLLVIQNPNE